MIRALVDMRGVTAMAIAAATGLWGVTTYPPAADNVFLQLIALREPVVFRFLVHAYAALWFSSSFMAASFVLSIAAIVAYRRPPTPRSRPLPRYPKPETRPSPAVVLGETHHHTTPGRAPEPAWLTIPQRGLYTGVMILGAVGTGKTSACMYPYVEQLLRWRAQDPDYKVGGLVLEVKGDFCHQVQDILTRAGRSDDYLEIGLESGFCYNPLHNDLDPYAVAYAVATLLNNLFGRGKEPFWQQAYTDLLKFVIALRRITEGYTTLSEVYRYVINDSLIDRNIRDLAEQFRQPGEYLVVSNSAALRGRCGRSWAHARWRTSTAPTSKASSPRTTFHSRCARGRKPSVRTGGIGWTPSHVGSTDPGQSSTTRSRHRSSKGSSSFCRSSTRIRPCTAPSARIDPRTRVRRSPARDSPCRRWRIWSRRGVCSA
jgi:hypothetical protein